MMGGARMDMTEYQNWEHDKLNSIHQDIEALEKMTGSEKMGESYDSGVLAGMLSNKGVDPGLLALMNNDGFGNNGLLLVLFLLVLGGGNGWGNRGGCDYAKESTLINESNYNALMNAISSQGTKQEVAIGDLATRFGCEIGQVKQALCGVDKAIALSNGDLKSAIQSVGGDLSSKISDCCCRTNLNIERGFSDVKQDIQATRYLVTATASAQDNLLQQEIQKVLGQMTQNQIAIQDQFCQLKNREDQREIQALRDKIAERDRDAILSAINGTKVVSGTLSSSAGTWSGTSTPS